MPFDAAAGEHVQFTVWNEQMGGWFARLLFIFVGAAALEAGHHAGSAPGPSRRLTASGGALDRTRGLPDTEGVMTFAAITCACCRAIQAPTVLVMSREGHGMV